MDETACVTVFSVGLWVPFLFHSLRPRPGPQLFLFLLLQRSPFGQVVSEFVANFNGTYSNRKRLGHYLPQALDDVHAFLAEVRRC